MAPIIVTDKDTLTLAHEFYREVKTYKADGLSVSQALEIVKMVFNNKKFVADFQPGSGSSSDEAVSTSEEQTSDESGSDDEESNVETTVTPTVTKRANTAADAATMTPATPPKFGVVSSLTPGIVELSPGKNSAQLFDYAAIKKKAESLAKKRKGTPEPEDGPSEKRVRSTGKPKGKPAGKLRR